MAKWGYIIEVGVTKPSKRTGERTAFVKTAEAVDGVPVEGELIQPIEAFKGGKKKPIPSTREEGKKD